MSCSSSRLGKMTKQVVRDKKGEPEYLYNHIV